MRAVARRWFYGLRTEGEGAGREAAAVGAGIFIGCLPFYGFHLLLCWVTARLLGLNRLKTYIAANISNPLIAPTLLFTELQAGAWVRRGTFHPLTLQTVRTTDLSVFWFDILTGSVALGATLGAALALATYLSLRGTPDDALFLNLVRDASDRYVTASVTAWEFARSKLRGDPLYRATVCGTLLPSGGTLVDIGCGSGLTLAILAEARERQRTGRWPVSWSPPPRFDRLIGIESRARPARVAQEALGADATIVHGDARTTGVEPCRAALLFDVLHMLRASEQDALLATVSAALEPGGVLLIREADAAGGWRFSLVRLGNGLKALALGHWRQRFHFRTAEQWLACFAARGLRARVRPMGAGTPFANVLFEVTAPAHASATALLPLQAV
jgi:SAM-dependent methyltransferase